MTQLNPSIVNIPMPGTIAMLPIGPNGYPVPWFVSWIDSDGRPVASDTADAKPEFRCADGRKWVRAVKEKLCWVCGTKLEPEFTFPIGPMCSINQVTAEPPCHNECAEYSVRACPFLTRPDMTRRDNNLPEDTTEAGLMIMRNPGVTCLWTCNSYQLFPDGSGSYLIRLPNPSRVKWYAQGRPALRHEIEASVTTGLCTLEDMARQQSPDAMLDLHRSLVRARKRFPAD